MQLSETDPRRRGSRPPWGQNLCSLHAFRIRGKSLDSLKLEEGHSAHRGTPLIQENYLQTSDWRHNFELSDMMKSSEAAWLAAEVNAEDCDWKPRHLKGPCGVFGAMRGQAGSEQWKNNCSIYKGPLNGRGSSVSPPGAQTASRSSCYHELTPSPHLIRTQSLRATCFLLVVIWSTDFLKFYILVCQACRTHKLIWDQIQPEVPFI